MAGTITWSRHSFKKTKKKNFPGTSCSTYIRRNHTGKEAGGSLVFMIDLILGGADAKGSGCFNFDLHIPVAFLEEKIRIVQQRVKLHT